jgi:hypothetical protein
MGGGSTSLTIMSLSNEVGEGDGSASFAVKGFCFFVALRLGLVRIFLAISCPLD